MLWDCQNCGVKQIAASLEECPVCHTPKPVEETEPNTDVAAGQDELGAAAWSPAPSESPDSFPAGEVVDVPPSHDEVGIPAEQQEEVQNG